MEQNTQTKRCRVCGEVKPLTDFYTTKSNKDGYYTLCKDCDKKLAHERYGKNDPLTWWKIRVNTAKQNAKKKGTHFELSKDLLPYFPERCPALGVELTYFGHLGGKFGDDKRDNQASIDRIDSSKGYTYDNIAIISWRANKIKSDATPDELLRVSNYVIGKTA